MEYKERMLRELSGLIERRTKLGSFLAEAIEPSDSTSKEKIELKKRQYEIMFQYENVLIQRLLLEMNS